MVNAFCVCTLHGVTYHVPGVVITSRGAYSCKAAPDLGEPIPSLGGGAESYIKDGERAVQAATSWTEKGATPPIPEREKSDGGDHPHHPED